MEKFAVIGLTHDACDEVLNWSDTKKIELRINYYKG